MSLFNMTVSPKKEARQFWLTTDLFVEIKQIQKEYGDERIALTIRRLLRQSLTNRALAKKGDSG